MKLKDKTVKLIRKSDLKTWEIAVGAGVPMHWLNSLLKTKSPEKPSEERLNAVIDFLYEQKKARK